MNIKELKEKLEFHKITNRISQYFLSDLPSVKIDNLEFLTNRDELIQELRKTDQMRYLINVEGEIDLSGLSDIRYLLKILRIDGSFISSAELLKVLSFLQVSTRVKSYFDSKERTYASECNNLFGICKDIHTDKLLEHNINITVDDDGEVKDSASIELRKLRSSLSSKEEHLRKTLLKLLRHYSEREISQDEIITQREGRFVIPVKVENKRSVPGIIHSASASGSTVFIEPGETIELNNEITEIRYKINREIQRILIEISSQVSEKVSELEVNCEILSEIDFLQAKSKYANEINAVLPKLSESHFNIKNAYHPILLQNHKRSDIIPLDISMDNKIKTIIITGPNAGGKTVALKTVGLLQLMFQCGILLPVADNTEMRLFKDIFVNIGDEQSIDNDLSTFSSHLKSLKGIIDNADSSSLVLIDEICSGTDPLLGSALSSAILKHLTESGVSTIVTTHIGELKIFAYNTEGIENASLEFNHKTLSPNYKFSIGVPGQSFTFEIASKYNYPESILNYARELSGSSGSDLEDLIKELNINKQKFENLKNSNELERARLSGLTKLYESKISELEKNKRLILNEAKLEASGIINNAKKLIDRTIRDIRENKSEIKKVVTGFQRTAKNLTEIQDTSEKIEIGEINKGDVVKIKNSGSIGKVIKSDGENVSVNMNGILVKVGLNKLEKIDQSELRERNSTDNLIEVNTSEISTELDLRGLYPEEANLLIERFLSEAQINGLNQVSIIHGKGTGKLREAVKQSLKNNPAVKEFRYGNWNEGDTGVTIVSI